MPTSVDDAIESRGESDIIARAETAVADRVVADTVLAAAAADTVLADAAIAPASPATTAATTATPSLAMVEVGAHDVDEESFAERYLVDRLLGRGGMGEVHACRDRRIGREVALKAVRREVVMRPEARQRFLREARVQGQLEHPAVVPVYDLGIAPDGGVFFTMKRIGGVTLAAVLDSEAERYSLHKLLAAFLQICLCIDYAHTRGVVHRDLKPENVMLGGFGEVYVLDWGIAKLEQDIAPAEARPSTTDEPVRTPELGATPTRAGQILGTPGYMSPEQIAAVPVDRRSDVYALGAILFEILTGERLHVGESVADLLESTRRGAAQHVGERALEHDIAPELVSICSRATAHQASDRFAGARALHDAVERYLDGDRDLEMRRAAAEDHATRAADAAERVASADDPAGAERSRALGEVGRALALDPRSRRARQTLTRLLTEPPRHPPPGALAEIDATRAKEERSAARVAAWSVSVVTFLASFAAVEVPTIRLLPTLLPAVAAAVSCFYLGYAVRRPRGLPLVVVLLVCAAVGSATGFMGPLVVTPGLALAIAIVAINIGRGRVYRATVVVAAALTVLLPSLLEMGGVITSSYHNVDGGILITPRLFQVPDRPYPVGVLLACLVTVVVPALFVWRLARANQALRVQLHVLKWQFGQLVPRDDDA